MGNTVAFEFDRFFLNVSETSLHLTQKGTPAWEREREPGDRRANKPTSPKRISRGAGRAEESLTSEIGFKQQSCEMRRLRVQTQASASELV